MIRQIKKQHPLVGKRVCWIADGEQFRKYPNSNWEIVSKVCGDKVYYVREPNTWAAWNWMDDNFLTGNELRLAKGMPTVEGGDVSR